jgi:hypothetical protein
MLATPPAIMRDKSSTRTPDSGVTIPTPSGNGGTCMDNYTRSLLALDRNGMLTTRERSPIGARAFPVDP